MLSGFKDALIKQNKILNSSTNLRPAISDYGQSRLGYAQCCGSKTLNLDPGPEFWPNLDPDPGL